MSYSFRTEARQHLLSTICCCRLPSAVDVGIILFRWVYEKDNCDLTIRPTRYSTPYFSPSHRGLPAVSQRTVTPLRPTGFQHNPDWSDVPPLLINLLWRELEVTPFHWRFIRRRTEVAYSAYDYKLPTHYKSILKVSTAAVTTMLFLTIRLTDITAIIIRTSVSGVLWRYLCGPSPAGLGSVSSPTALRMGG